MSSLPATPYPPVDDPEDGASLHAEVERLCMLRRRLLGARMPLALHMAADRIDRIPAEDGGPWVRATAMRVLAAEVRSWVAEVDTWAAVVDADPMGHLGAMDSPPATITALAEDLARHADYMAGRYAATATGWAVTLWQEDTIRQMYGL